MKRKNKLKQLACYFSRNFLKLDGKIAHYFMSYTQFKEETILRRRAENSVYLKRASFTLFWNIALSALHHKCFSYNSS